MKTGYQITVDNSSVKSHNINVDYPTYFVHAINKAEAIGLMMLSDFEHKNLPIYRIDEF